MNRENGVAALGVGLAGVLTGNEVGTMGAVHPALSGLPMPAQLMAEQAVTRRYGVMMPPLMTATIAATAAASRATTGTRRRLFGAAAGSYSVMLAVTLAGNVPLNAATLKMPSSVVEPEFRSLRRRWERLHRIRVGLDLLGLTLAAVAASRGSSR